MLRIKQVTTTLMWMNLLQLNLLNYRWFSCTLAISFINMTPRLGRLLIRTMKVLLILTIVFIIKQELCCLCETMVASVEMPRINPKLTECSYAIRPRSFRSLLALTFTRQNHGSILSRLNLIRAKFAQLFFVIAPGKGLPHHDFHIIISRGKRQ